MQDLQELYGLLADPAGSGDLYSARALDDRPNYRVGRDPFGNVALLISPRPTPDAPPPPVELRNLSYHPRCACRVQLADGTSATETLAVLKCTSSDPSLREYFLSALNGTIALLPSAPQEHEISASVMKLAELFRALDAPPRRSLQGTWCELLLITHAPRVRQAVAAWHADPGARYDFAAGRQRLEVKSTAGQIRAHHFSLEQLRSSNNEQVVLASFVLEEDPRGPSISNLWDELARRPELTNDGRDRVARILALALGRDWRDATTTRFHDEHALEHLRIYDAAVVPSVSPDLPAGVDEVRFRAELTDVPHLSRAIMGQRGGMLDAILGHHSEQPRGQRAKRLGR